MSWVTKITLSVKNGSICLCSFLDFVSLFVILSYTLQCPITTSIYVRIQIWAWDKMVCVASKKACP